jgi:hypothetical protein
MTKNTSYEEDQKYYNFIKSYDFFYEGRLDYYAFCVHFSECLSRDKKFTLNNPNNIGELLIELILKSTEAGSWFTKTVREDIPKEANHIYPNGEFILIHISGFSEYIHEFIWTLGQRVLTVTPTDNDNYFAYWLTSEDIYTYAFLDKLFSDIRSLVKKADKKGTLKAMLQNMSLAKGFDLGITDNLLVKDDISSIAVERISKAVSGKYYLEAITLQESIISDRLAMYLHHQGKKSDSKTLNQLIIDVQDHHKKTLFEKVDLWRKKRNKAVHGLVRSSPFESQIGIIAFDKLAKETAIEGQLLVSEITSWFDEYVYEHLNIFQIVPYYLYAGHDKKLN